MRPQHDTTGKWGQIPSFRLAVIPHRAGAVFGWLAACTA